MADRPSVTEEYDLGDSTFDPTLDLDSTSSVRPAPSVPVAAPDSPSAQPKDPETGKFVKKAHHPRLVNAARELGMSAEEIDELSPADLRETIHFASLERLATRRDTATANHVEGQPSGAGAAQGSAPPVPTTPEPSFLSREFLDQLQPEFATFLQSLHADVQALKGQVQTVSGHVGQQIRESTAAQLDRQFESLPEARYGKGRGLAMKDDDPALARRRLVIQQAERLAGEGANLQAVLAKIGDADALIFGESTEPPPPPPNGTAPGWPVGATVARATQRQPAEEPRGAGRAARAVAAKMRDRGLTEESFDGIEEAGLPE